MIKHSVCIYLLFDSTTMRGYVGKSYDLEKRIRNHWENRFKLDYYVHRWLRKLSFLPQVIILEECTQRNWQSKERYWIRLFRSVGILKLTNLTDGGEGTTGYIHTEEHKENIRRALMGNSNSYGMRHSQKTRRRISESRKGIVFSKGHCCRISKARKGYTPWNKGISTGPRTQETRIKISNSHVGRRKSEETKIRMKESQRKRRILESQKAGVQLSA